MYPHWCIVEGVTGIRPTSSGLNMSRDDCVPLNILVQRSPQIYISIIVEIGAVAWVRCARDSACERADKAIDPYL